MNRKLLLFPALLLSFTACAVDNSVTNGEVVGKRYYEGCDVREVIGTASGAMAYDRTVDPAYTVEVRYQDEDADGEPVTRTTAFVVSEEDYAEFQIGDDFTRDYTYWYDDECSDEAATPLD